MEKEVVKLLEDIKRNQEEQMAIAREQVKNQTEAISFSRQYAKTAIWKAVIVSVVVVALVYFVFAVIGQLLK